MLSGVSVPSGMSGSDSTGVAGTGGPPDAADDPVPGALDPPAPPLTVIEIGWGVDGLEVATGDVGTGVGTGAGAGTGAGVGSTICLGGW